MNFQIKEILKFPKQGKSKRGLWSKEQREYVTRCVEFGCIACWLGRGIGSSPAAWHHCKEKWHGVGMRSPHEYGLALCPFHHDQSIEESVHLNPEGFRRLIGMSEADAVRYCWDRFGWSSNTFGDGVRGDWDEAPTVSL